MDGYLNSQIAVSRALGDWHMEVKRPAEGACVKLTPLQYASSLTPRETPAFALRLEAMLWTVIIKV